MSSLSIVSSVQGGLFEGLRMDEFVLVLVPVKELERRVVGRRRNALLSNANNL